MKTARGRTLPPAAPLTIQYHCMNSPVINIDTLSLEERLHLLEQSWDSLADSPELALGSSLDKRPAKSSIADWMTLSGGTDGNSLGRGSEPDPGLVTSAIFRPAAAADIEDAYL